MQNHGHDSIGACGRDIVYEDVISRYRQSRELAMCVFERAFMDVAGDVDLRDWNRDDAAIVRKIKKTLSKICNTSTECSLLTQNPLRSCVYITFRICYLHILVIMV